MNASFLSTVTLDKIRQKKAEKLTDIRMSRQHITNHVHALFNPSPTTNSSNTLISTMGSGISIFNGILTGFKIIKQIRNFFRQNRNG